MKIVNIILSIITILFAILGPLGVLSSDITYPMMLIALAALLVLRSAEYKKARDHTGCVFTLATAVFVYVVVIYNVFTG